jgi:hypothetical protein
MPNGVPIVAALDGTVRMVRGDSRNGGCDPHYAAEANYVVITHDGGMETQYLHLERVVVKPGDQLKSGDLLGFSGSTGWACGSHLHFKVARSDGSSWNNPSVPARIKGYGDPDAETWVRSEACGTLPAVASVPVETKDGSHREPRIASGSGVEVASSAASKQAERGDKPSGRKLPEVSASSGAGSMIPVPAKPSEQGDRPSAGGSAADP